MPEPYNIGSGLSDQELKVASFWVRNRLVLRQVGYGSLIGISIILWGYVLWSLLDAYAISYPRESRIPRLVASNELALSGLEQSAPRAVQVSEVSVFDAPANRQDFLVEVVNPNPQWAATFTYRFIAGAEVTPDRQGYILPNSSRYLTELGYEPDQKTRSARLEVTEIRWQRVDPADVDRDYAAFAERRLALEATDIEYTRDLVIGTQNVGQSSFTLKNQTAYGYWNVELVIVLFRGNIPAAVTSITERQVKPGESRDVIVNWPDNPAGISRTEIRPSVNILDPAAYLPSEEF